MRYWWLEITLKSDMCAASGECIPGLIDMKTALEYGVPYIPGKRLKGCLRDIGSEMADSKIFSIEVLNKVFGEVGSAKPGILRVHDAHLYKIPGGILKSSDERNWMEINDYSSLSLELRMQREIKEEELEEILTRTRTRTAMEKGVAKKGSLRTMQVVPRGMIFRSCLELDGESSDKEAEEILTLCVKGLRHIGLGITRGFGEVMCELKELRDPEAKVMQPGKEDCILGAVSSNEEGELNFELELQEPVLIAGENGMYEDCTDWIPGGVLQGALAGMYIQDKGLGSKAHKDEGFRRIFLQDGVEFGFAFLKRGDNVYYPCPLSLVKEKHTQVCFHRLDASKEGIKRKEISSQIFLNGDKVYEAIPEKEIHMHHARPVDRGIGHALNDRVKQPPHTAGQFFQYAALSKGQLFAGKWKGKTTDLKELLACLERRDYKLRIGRSRGAEYGAVRFIPVKRTARGTQEDVSKRWILWAKSPLVVRDPFSGLIEPKIKHLETQMSMELDCKITIGETPILKFTRIDGYNSRWRLPAVQYPAFDQGTVMILSSDKEISKARIENQLWGDMTGKGYGYLEAVAESAWEQKSYTILEEMVEEPKKKNDSQLFQSLRNCVFHQRQLKEEIFSALKANPPMLNSTKIEQLLCIHENGSLPTFKTIEAFAQNISDNTLKEKVKRFIEPCRDKSPEYIQSYMENAKWMVRREKNGRN